LSTSSLNSRPLGDFGDGFKGVKGELGVPDLELLPSKMVSLSLELLAELVDVVELLGCGLGRRLGVLVVVPWEITTVAGPVGSEGGELAGRRGISRLGDDMLGIGYRNSGR
jgi:hypothetical protein